MNIKNIIIFLVVIVLFYYILVLYRDHCIFPKVFSICKEKQERLKILLPIIIAKLDQFQIKHFIFSGTLLGYKRHNKRFIPWDDDVDLVLINTSDIHKKIQKINNQIAPEFKISKTFFGYKFVDENDIFVDLFIFEEKNNLIKTNDLMTSIMWPNDYFIKDEAYPLYQDVFEGVVVNIPRNPELYLKRQYGNWKDVELIINHYVSYIDNIIIKFIKYNHSNSLKKSYRSFRNNKE